MVLVWALFTFVLFVAEPWFLHAWFRRRASVDPDGTFAGIQRFHWILLTASVVTVGGAVLAQRETRTRAARRKYWRYRGETWQLIERTLPNAAHRALADLAMAGRVDLLVTQSVAGWSTWRASFGLLERVIRAARSSRRQECCLPEWRCDR